MPQRTCIGCRRVDDQSSMRRLVKSGGVVVEATSPRSEGRGAYFHEACAALVVQRKAIARAFKGAEPSPQLTALLRVLGV